MTLTGLQTGLAEATAASPDKSTATKRNSRAFLCPVEDVVDPLILFILEARPLLDAMQTQA